MHLVKATTASSSTEPPFLNYPHRPYPTSGDPTLGQRIVVFSDGDFNGAPGIVLAPSGDLLTVWGAGTSHSSGTHTNLSRSPDLGRTWPDPSVVSGVIGGPNLRLLSDGRIALTYHDGPGVKVRFSSDDGVSFGDAVSVDGVSDDRLAAPVVELDDGTLLLPIYTGASSPRDAVVVKSTDGGATFGSPVTVASGGGDWAEPWVELLDDGTLHMLIREDGNSDMYRSTSTDDGATWSTPALAFSGTAPGTHLQLASGAIVAVYRRDAASKGDMLTVMRTSWDGGATWGSEVVVDSTSGMMMYAQMVEVSGGQVALAYGIESPSTDTVSDIWFRYLIDGDGITPVGDDTLTTGADFTGLSDTPSSYSGQAGKAAVVNTAEDGLEFGDVDTTVDTADVRDAGRWEVVVDGSPPTAVTNEAEDDWVYGWISG